MKSDIRELPQTSIPHLLAYQQLCSTFPPVTMDKPSVSAGQSLHFVTSSHSLSVIQWHHSSNSLSPALTELSFLDYSYRYKYSYFSYLKKASIPLPIHLLLHFSVFFTENFWKFLPPSSLFHFFLMHSPIKPLPSPFFKNHSFQGHQWPPHC